MNRAAHCYFQGDLFHTYSDKNLRFKENVGNQRQMKKIYKYDRKKALIAKIFFSFMKMVIKDMIENGTTFHLPNKNLAMFTWDKLQGEKFKKSINSGKIDNLDYIMSNFTLYFMIFKYFYAGKFSTKNIVVNNTLKDKITEKANQGFSYC